MVVIVVPQTDQIAISAHSAKTDKRAKKLHKWSMKEEIYKFD